MKCIIACCYDIIMCRHTRRRRRIRHISVVPLSAPSYRRTVVLNEIMNDTGEISFWRKINTGRRKNVPLCPLLNIITRTSHTLAQWSVRIMPSAPKRAHARVLSTVPHMLGTCLAITIIIITDGRDTSFWPLRVLARQIGHVAIDTYYIYVY